MDTEELSQTTGIADTGFVLAVAISTDAQHAACLAIYRQQQSIYLPQSTLAEVAYLLMRAGGNTVTARFLSGLSKTKYRLVALEAADVSRSAELLLQYSDVRVDFVDISLVALAERLNVTRILTLDRRDFQIVRPRHCAYFELLP